MWTSIPIRVDLGRFWSVSGDVHWMYSGVHRMLETLRVRRNSLRCKALASKSSRLSYCRGLKSNSLREKGLWNRARARDGDIERAHEGSKVVSAYGITTSYILRHPPPGGPPAILAPY